MPTKNVIKQEKGIKLIEIKVNDEYDRQYRTSYEINDIKGNRLGNSFSKINEAEKLFNLIISDLKG